jgi:hypothetical protein
MINDKPTWLNNESDEYKRGWYDGYQAARRDYTNTQPSDFWPHIRKQCLICGRDQSKLDAYVCYNTACPTRMTSQVSQVIGSAEPLQKQIGGTE